MSGIMIYEKMSRAIGQVDAVTKSKKNSQQGYAYRGVDDAMSAVNKVLSELQLCLTVNYQCEKDDMITIKDDKIFNKVRVKGYFRIYAVDGSSIECATVGIAYDYSDKAANKAMSFSLKYFLFQTFMIPTEDIEDGDKDHITHPKEQKLAQDRINEVTEIERIKKTMPKDLQSKIKDIGLTGSQVINLVSVYKGSYDNISKAGEETNWEYKSMIDFA